MSEISKMLNLGPKSAEWLAEIGIETREQVEQLGAVVVFQMLRQAGRRPSLNMLYALEAALTEVHWNQLSEKRKNELRKQVNAED